MGSAGGGLGLLLAPGALAVLKAALTHDMPGGTNIALNSHVLVFTGLLAVLAGLAFGWVPAWSASKVSLADALKSGGRITTGRVGTRVRSPLIVGEITLAVVLAVSAGLLIKSLWRLAQVNPGFDSRRILTVRISPLPSMCEQRAACIAFYNQLLDRAHGITGVSEVAAANTVPLDGQYHAIPVEIEGYPQTPATNPAPMFWAGTVTPDYIRIMRVPLLEGRTFRNTDTEKSAPVVILSAATARKWWPEQDPIGKHIRPVWDGEPWRTVVGVVGDVRQYNLATPFPGGIDGAIYLPYPQADDIRRQLPASMDLVLRTNQQPSQIGGEIRSLVASTNPEVPVSPVRTMKGIVSGSLSQSRSMMWLFVSFASLALLLAAIGTYGVISYSTSQRTSEIAIRLAVGATRADILALVLSQSLRLVLAGLALGIAISFPAVRTLAAFLYGTNPADAMTFLSVSGLLLITALLASFVPARKAAGTDLLTALRVQ